MGCYLGTGTQNLSSVLFEDFLFLYLESDNCAALGALENGPIECEWQRLVGPMLQAGGYSKWAEPIHIGW
jgi:hypothetical protein